jgi:hypothetical protein
MKRILCLLSLLLFLTACDDGDLTVDPIDFSEGAIQKCNLKEVLYKVKGSEMIFIEIPSTYFADNQTITDIPIEVAISNAATSPVKVTYRKYASETSADNICPTAPDATPNLIEQWEATDGIIQITSTAIKTTDSTTGFVKITGYIYSIKFKNIIFLKPDGPQTQEDIPFGNYTKNITPLAFGFDTEVDKSTCSASDNRIFNFSTSEALILDAADYSTLIVNQETPIATPRTASINATNKLSYRLYSGQISNAYFCAVSPTSPTLVEQWDAESGVAGTSGIIEVETTTLGSSFRHTIHLKNVTMKKGNSEFNLGPDYIFGSFVTTP